MVTKLSTVYWVLYCCHYVALHWGRGIQEHSVLYLPQGVRERARVFETFNFFKRPDVAVLCVFSGNTIACSCSMSATGVPSKALKVRQPAAKHYQLKHLCLLPNSLPFIDMLRKLNLQTCYVSVRSTSPLAESRPAWGLIYSRGHCWGCDCEHLAT